MLRMMLEPLVTLSKKIRIQKIACCHGHKSNESLDLGDDHMHDDDDVGHGYYDEDKEFDIEYKKTMRNLSLMAKL